MGSSNRSPPFILLGRLRPFRNAYLGRGFVVWVGLRMALAASGVPDPGVPAEIALLGAVALVVVLDARRRSEDLFLANLGIPGWAIGALALPIALMAELLVP